MSRRLLNAQFLEREAEVEAILTAVLAKQHTLLIGPAGTGKSALASQHSQVSCTVVLKGFVTSSGY